MTDTIEAQSGPGPNPQREHWHGVLMRKIEATPLPGSGLADVHQISDSPEPAQLEAVPSTRQGSADVVQQIQDALASIQPGSPEAQEITASQTKYLDDREAEIVGDVPTEIATEAIGSLIQSRIEESRGKTGEK